LLWNQNQKINNNVEIIINIILNMNKILHIFLGSIMILCFSFDSILVKNSIMHINSYFFNIFRFGIIALVLLPFLKISKLNKKLMLGAFGLSILNISGRDIALKLNNSLFCTDLVGQCDILISIPFAILVFKEHFTKKDLIGFFITLIGFFFILSLNLFHDLENERFLDSFSLSNFNQQNFLSLFFLFSSWFGWPLFIYSIKQNEEKMNILEILSLISFSSSLLCLIFAFIYPNYSMLENFQSIINFHMIPKIFYAGIFGIIIPSTIWFFLSKTYKYYQISIFVLISPFLTGILAYFFLDQKLTIPFLLAGMLIVYGSYLASSSSKEKELKI